MTQATFEVLHSLQKLNSSSVSSGYRMGSVDMDHRQHRKFYWTRTARVEMSNKDGNNTLGTDQREVNIEGDG